MRKPIKFYVDEHVATAVVKGLRERGADVLTVLEAGLRSASDEEHDDFLRLHATGFSHAGIAFAPQGTYVGDIIRGLMLIYQLLEAEDMQGHVEYL